MIFLNAARRDRSGQSTELPLIVVGERHVNSHGKATGKGSVIGSGWQCADRPRRRPRFLGNSESSEDERRGEDENEAIAHPLPIILSVRDAGS